ncbi:MAG: Crp/Fnr family transcriptional regulator [Xenococcaceae cyanobacterium MO_207.B15]|nr:Crp/Fnr family transcriptional regulator [Xenococcaceae cyanobacterium MO_207.B15]MDJ0744725.1 Crp/Fnr family transcriptional regulator [Xenococcaceae cyanobacterium MO_167.B27]
MQFFDRSSEASRPFLTWQRIVDWAQIHYRDRIFRKDELIPARPGLLYLVNKGVIRLAGKTTQLNSVNENASDIIDSPESNEDFPEETFLGFVPAGQPFEIVAQSCYDLQAYSHLDGTHVIWLYWHDLDNWPHFRKEVYEALRYQHQRKLLWLSALGQRRTIDRLMSFINLLIEEYGEPYEQGYCLPYILTHAQIGSSIGSTRVTVTRLMGKLRRQGLITIRDDNSICVPDIRH